MKFTFKSYKGDKNSSEEPSPPADPANPREKRKDQIRRAQKTHRERKEAYTKSLEVEVVQLRANEARILQETRGLYAEITALKKVLMKNGIPIPAAGFRGIEDISKTVESFEQDSFELSIRHTKTRHTQQRINIQRNRSAHHRHEFSSPASDQDKGEMFDATEPSNFSHPFLPSTASPIGSEKVVSASPTKRLGELDLTAIGMDFILSLESPCLSHVLPASQDATTGHALTVSAALLHQHPIGSELRLSSAQSEWQLPAVGIEQLLQLSSSIPLPDDEITPVQAWDLIRKNPELAELEVERLERLREKLLKDIRCYGFGGVIDRQRFENALFDTFVVGRVF